MSLDTTNKLPSSSDLYDFCKRHNISVSTGFREISSGKLTCIKIGRSTRITLEDELIWIEQCKKKRSLDVDGIYIANKKGVDK